MITVQSVSPVCEATTNMSSTRNRRTNSKHGCRTCKIRKVKCDESRPSCARCVTTGRVCDGYGIWGGGGNTWAQRCSNVARQPYTAQDQVKTSRLPQLNSLTVLPGGTLDLEEQYHLNWFWRRTARKIPGAFYTESGNALLYQASASDLAVTHAILAACSAHRDTNQSLTLSTPTRLRKDEGFALKQYNKAIKHLQRHLEAKDTLSLRITLFTCVVFVYVELFRSHYLTARKHLEHGLKLLSDGSKWWQSSGFGAILANDWAFGTLRRLYVHFILFGLGPRCSLPEIDSKQRSLTRPQGSTFNSLTEARNLLENILLDIHESTHDAHDELSLHKRRTKLEKDLSTWAIIADSTIASPVCKADQVMAFGYSILRIYHTMAQIQVAVLGSTSETQYDRQYTLFARIISEINAIRVIALSAAIRQRFFGTETGLPHSIGDNMGPVMPLFYLATKCRSPRLRRHAVMLMNEEPRKEGIWDTSLTSAIAWLVVGLEEEGLDLEAAEVNDITLNEMPPEHGLLGQKLPMEARRVSITAIVLPDRPWEPVFVDLRRFNVDTGEYLVERLLVEPGKHQVMCHEYSHGGSPMLTGISTPEPFGRISEQDLKVC